MKLDKIKVIDLSQFLPGPHLTMMMADHGAEVIKVEPLTGEPTRQIGARQAGHSIYFRNTHRGKQSLRLNLKHPDGREILLRLAERSDVLIEAFRPGVVDRLGIGYSAVSARAPHLVYCSLSAFGQSGPYRDRPAHDLAVEAIAGLVSLNVGQDGQPAMPGVEAADLAASMTALSGILMALLAQRHTGRGDHLDLSMHDSLLAWAAHMTGSIFAEQRPPDPQRERFWGGAAFYGLYATRDGRWIALGGSEHKFAERFLRRFQREDLLPWADRPAGEQEPLKAALRTLFAQHTFDEWLAWLAELDIPYGPVRDLKQALDDPHTRAREMLMFDGEGTPHVGVPIKFAREPAQPRLSVPALGEHSSAIVKALGYSDDEVDRLQAEGVI